MLMFDVSYIVLTMQRSGAALQLANTFPSVWELRIATTMPDGLLSQCQIRQYPYAVSILKFCFFRSEQKNKPMLLHYELFAWQVYAILACATHFYVAEGAEMRQYLVIFGVP